MKTPRKPRPKNPEVEHEMVHPRSEEGKPPIPATEPVPHKRPVKTSRSERKKS
jgi:hypothetical protein